MAGSYWLMVEGSWTLYRFSGGELRRGWLEIGSAMAVAGEHGDQGMDASWVGATLWAGGRRKLWGSEP